MTTPEDREADQEARIKKLEESEFGKPVPVPPTPEPTPSPSNTPLKITAATGSTFDATTPPTNAIDNDPNTRFSSLGVGAFLKLDLGAVQEIDKIDFEWYNSPPRTYTVDVVFEGAATLNHISDDTGKSSLVVPSIAAQTITIKLVDTSNVKKWLSIVDVRVFGKELNPVSPTPVPPTPTPTPSPTPTPTPGPSSKQDVFGIAKVYDDDTSGPRNNWNMTGASDPRFMESNPVATSGGWFTYKSLAQGRIEVMSEPGLTEDKFETFWIDTLIKQGYAWKPIDSPDGRGDFGNVETTIKYRNISEGSGSFESHPEFVYALFRQTNDTKMCGKDKKVPASCQAGSYHANIYKARSKFEKDTKHTEGYTAKDPESKIGYGPAGQSGFVHKAVYYRVPNSNIPGGFAMKLEQYMSIDDGKTFKKIIEFLDDGKWGPSKGGHNSVCGCSEYVVHNYGHPTLGIRIDFMKSFEFRDWSIRSIDPSKKLIN